MALGGAEPPRAIRSIDDRIAAARAILARLRAGSPAYAAQARELRHLLRRRATE